MEALTKISQSLLKRFAAALQGHSQIVELRWGDR